MLLRASTSDRALGVARSLVLVLLFGVGALCPRTCRAQACCAGASAVTPGRLALHERALVGARLSVAPMLGSYDANARFRGPAEGSSAWDFEQDVFGSVRLFERAQVSLLVPVLESLRRTKSTGSEFGGGLGDLNASARYDFTWAREYRSLPGLAVLAGVTVPTGTPPESAQLPLGSDATGTGAVQLNLGVSAERAVGDWFLSVSGLLAKRLARTVDGVTSGLAVQATAIAAIGYSFSEDLTVAGVTTYTGEGNASVEGAEVAGTAKHRWRLGAVSSVSVSDTVRVSGDVFLDPPFDGAGRNQLSLAGLSMTFIRSFL